MQRIPLSHRPIDRRPIDRPIPEDHLPRVVALGGGTGLPVVLQGLQDLMFPAGRLEGDRDRLTAIVTVADEGGSSGRLRQAYGVLPPGDIRSCLLALANPDSTLAALFDYRFDGLDEISGHSLGNLILTALSRIEQDFLGAIERGSSMLGVRGRVFPSTLDDVRLRAEFWDGSSVEGESRIAGVAGTIRRVSLEPQNPAALSPAVAAITDADIIVIGPGSLYTSVIPVLLVGELSEAIAQSRARTVLVMNLTTEPGETDRYTAADHVIAIRRHVPHVPIHEVLLNATPIPDVMVRSYAASGSEPVALDIDLLRALGYRPLLHDLIGAGPKIRHDGHKVAAAVLERARDTAAELLPDTSAASVSAKVALR
jgi:uncharacterized cofD-like protein